MICRPDDHFVTLFMKKEISELSELITLQHPLTFPTSVVFLTFTLTNFHYQSGFFSLLEHLSNPPPKAVLVALINIRHRRPSVLSVYDLHLIASGDHFHFRSSPITMDRELIH